MSAWLTAILANRREFASLASGGKRKKRVFGLIAEFLIYVPASAVLVILLGRPFSRWDPIGSFVREHSFNEAAFYATLGMLAYKFPVASIRQFLIRAALESINQILLRIHEKLKSSVEKR